MGNYLSRYWPQSLRKRTLGKRSKLDFEEKMHTPKRKKLTSTTKFIYKSLFIEGHSSDISIIALGNEWKLHKLYLSQSPYFSSMFYGGWKESDQSVISLQVFDENINVEALSTVLGSLYLDEVVIKPVNVIPILAAAVMFQLDNLISQCFSVMKETTNVTTVIKYYDASEEYGLSNLKTFTMKWLLYNLLTTMQNSPQNLRQVDVSLMISLVKSPDLFIIQTEFCLYTLLKSWLFLKENTNWDGTSFHDCLAQADEYFKDGLLENEYFLDTDVGKKYSDAFSSLRLQHMLNHIDDVKVIEKDRIIPSGWLQPLYRNLWCSMLRVAASENAEVPPIEEAVFNAECMRFGRVILTDKLHVWRWTGYNYNSNLVMSYNSRMLYVKRQEYSSDSLNFNVVLNMERLYAKQNFVLQVTVASFDDEQKHLTYKKSTSIKMINFRTEEEHNLLKLNKNATFPLVIIAKFMFKI